jgi:hypothetical protein
MGLLHDIGMKYQTDKAWRHGYMDFYEQFFAPIRNDVKKVIEIGVLNGSSIKTWLEYFPNATIYGIDCYPLPEVLQHERFVFITKDALKEDVYGIFSDEDIDIVIDDGSHLMSHQQDTLKYYWPKIKPNGYFVMEDLHTSFVGESSITKFIDRLPTTYDILVNNLDSQDVELNAIRKNFCERHDYNRDGTFHFKSSLTSVIKK